jgi:hypothetical protein
MLSRLVLAALLTVSGATMVAAQGEVTIPSDAQLERMEERAITTNPLHDREPLRFAAGRKRRICKWTGERIESTSASSRMAGSAPTANDPTTPVRSSFARLSAICHDCRS